MGYSLHIERPEGESSITLDEWRGAVQRTTQFRLASGDVEFENPKTHEKIRIPNSGADVEILVPPDQWVRAFSWSPSGSISFRADFLSAHSLLVEPVFALAEELNAIVVGDDGEEYDRESFELG
jgi:hypothetical protein